MNILFLRKIRNFLAVTVAILALFIFSVYVYAKYFELPDLTYKPLPFPMVNPTVYPGGVAAAIATRCNTRSTILSYESTREFKRENSTQPAVILTSVKISAEPGCNPVSTRANVVPDDTQPGFYRFSGVALVPGLIGFHEVGWNTDVFEVIAKPPATPPAKPPVAVAAPLVLPIENATVKIEVQPK